MVFTVENGTGLSTANAYVSTEYVTDYLTVRGVSAVWVASSNGAKEAAIINATDYMDARFSERYLGSPLTTTQRLSFPRKDVTEAYPERLKEACAEYTRRALEGLLGNDPAPLPTGDVKSVKKKVGPIETATEYLETNEPKKGMFAKDSFPIADAKIAPLLIREFNGINREVIR